MSLNEECLLELCSLGGRSMMSDVITLFCQLYWYLSFCFSYLVLIEWSYYIVVFFMSIDEGAGDLVRVEGGQKFDDMLGRRG